ncbi:hypothetical protein, partial [Methanocalculus sp.]|uniref:hypothetical protein n=1 Tax=Methanocalculus sp. TaxID=2004547 RepID=UPI00262ADCF8
TVGIEALIRGKPVLVFGAAKYRGAKGVFAVNSMSEIKSALQQIEDGFTMPSDSELLQYFEWVNNNSFAMTTASSQSFIKAIKIAITINK